MKKSIREAQRIARDLGLVDAIVTAGNPHGRITGTVNGRSICVVVSLSKCLATKRTQAELKASIRRAMRETMP
jgi:hypothetical protein